MARKEIPDTTVLIEVSRNPRLLDPFLQWLGRGSVWLSAVSIAELYAGTRSRDDVLQIDQFVEAVSSRLLTPSYNDWVIAGKLLRQHLRVIGPLDPRDHISDVLILVAGVGEDGNDIVTANVRHFDKWANLARRSGLDVTVSPYRRTTRQPASTEDPKMARRRSRRRRRR